MKKENFLILFFLGFSIIAWSQTITVDLEQQRFLGDVSSLNRANFFNLHNFDGDETSSAFLEENNVGFGRRFFGPFADRSFVNPRGNFPTTAATSDGVVRPVRRFIATANPGSVWRPGDNTENASNAAVRYFIDEVDDANRPEFWEPFNEPFIKAGDFGGVTSDVITEMSIWFREMAAKIHATPELGNMKVLGFSDAFPSYERRGFINWRDRQKKFIDIVGDEMDGLSIHAYDGVNVVGQANGRSGSNSEAILDLAETYTALKFGKPSKLAITEFGVIEDTSLYGGEEFSDSENALSIRGLNSMLFNFLEREDNTLINIPFITGRADFWYANGRPDKAYTPALVWPTALRDTPNPDSPNLYRNNDLVLTWKQNFYKLWKNVSGERATVNSNDLDIQAQLFKRGNKAFLIVNNLDEADRTFNVSFLSGGTDISSITEKSVIVNGILDPIYSESTVPTNIFSSAIQLVNGETKVYEITYDAPIAFTKTIIRTKYYGNPADVTLASEFAPVLKASDNTEHQFNFAAIDLGPLNSGKAILRLGVGVPLVEEFGGNQGNSQNLNVLPTEVKINGTAITIPTNWRGYDQNGRIEFFGVIEIDVPYNLLQASSNVVTVRYQQAVNNSGQAIALGGGVFERPTVSIASVILSVESESNDTCTPVLVYADTDDDGLGDPNDSIMSCLPAPGFVTNADDECPDDPTNVCNGLPIPGNVEAEAFTEASGNIGVSSPRGSGTAIDFIQNGAFTEYDVNVADTGSYNVRISAGADNNAGGTITIFANGVQVGTQVITGTGGFRNFIDFNSSVNLTAGTQKLRLEYSGTGNGGGFLFDLDFFDFSLLTLSTNEFNNEIVRLSRNPVEDNLSFTTASLNGEAYSIYQLGGKAILSGNYNNSGVNVNTLATGLYIIKIKNSFVKFVKK